LYKDRLVGVLNLEKPTSGCFPDDVEAMAQACATLVAQAIRHRELDRFYTGIVEADNLGRVADIVRDVGRLLEAPFASFYLWDALEQRPRLQGSSMSIDDEEAGKPLTQGDACYTTRGIGCIRWTLEHGLWLLIQDV